ncbi:MAG: GFA family protein [Reyranella sp.]|nr:MAG: GFA family protein [Reyranella sp.]
MCRRWTGAAFATLVWFDRTDVEWRRGSPAIHRSSPVATRAHCPTCGTPLYLAYDSRDDIALTAGSLDNPQAVTPTSHYGVESRLKWADIGRDLRTGKTRESW